jgi:hypothetical protein
MGTLTTGNSRIGRSCVTILRIGAFSILDATVLRKRGRCPLNLRPLGTAVFFLTGPYIKA